jgi:hypothetical protein
MSLRSVSIRWDGSCRGRRREVVPGDLNFLSPHLASCVKRFGDYKLNTAKTPVPWLDDQPPPRKRPDRVPSQSVLPFVKEA